jgi:hypothetical protein
VFAIEQCKSFEVREPEEVVQVKFSQK